MAAKSKDKVFFSRETRERMLSVDEMAALLKVEKRELVEWVQYRRIPFVRVNNQYIRFRMSDIVEWIKTSHKEREKFHLR